jgi:PST family polysaccharide transporter
VSRGRRQGPEDPPVAEPSPSPSDLQDRAAAEFGGSVRRGFAWSAVAYAGGRILTLLSVLVIARLLSPAEFGVVAAVAAYVALIELGGDLGMQPAVVYEQERGISDRVQTAFTVNLLVAAALTAVGVALAPAIARFFDVPDQTWLFRLGALNLLLTGLGNVHDGLLLRDMRFARRIKPQLARDLVRASVSIGLALAGLGAEALIFGLLAGSATWAAGQWLLTPLRPRLTLERAAAREMIAYGAPAALLSIIAVIQGRIDVIVIGHVIGSSALGVYTLAYRLPEALLSSVAYTLAVVAFPALARRRASAPDRLADATLSLLRYQALYALPMAATLALLAQPIIRVLFSAQWHAAAAALVPIAIAAAIVTTIFPLGDLLKAVGRQRTLVAVNLVEMPVLIGGCILGAHSGIVGVGWAVVCGAVLFATLVVGSVGRELGVGIGRFASACAPGLAAAGGALIGGLAVRAAWPALTLPALVLAVAATAAGAILALRLLAPAMFADVARQTHALRRSRRQPSDVR